MKLFELSEKLPSERLNLPFRLPPLPCTYPQHGNKQGAHQPYTLSQVVPDSSRRLVFFSFFFFFKTIEDMTHTIRAGLKLVEGINLHMQPNTLKNVEQVETN